MRRRWLGTGLALLGLVAALYWGITSDRSPLAEYSPGELARLFAEANHFHDNLRVALAPAFQPLAVDYLRKRYHDDALDVNIRRISVREDGRFPVTVEVLQSNVGVYLQEKFLFWWDDDRWRLTYLEGDL